MRGPALLACMFAAACAASGTSGSQPVMAPAEAEALYARHTGTWSIVEDLSDPASAALETAGEMPRRDGMGDRPESSSGAIRPAFQRAGDAQDNVARRMDRTAMRQTMMMAGKRPDSLTVRLSAAGMEITYAGREPWVLPADGSKIEVREDLMPAKVRLVWEDGLAIVEREVDNGGVIREIFETAPNGGTLWLTRQVLMAAGAWRPAQFTYGR